jgi:hypothetical protein
LDAHLSVDDVAAMVDGRLTAADRARVEGHLAVCRLCRAEVTAATQILESAPRPTRMMPRWIVGAGLAAAAGLLFMIVPGKQERPQGAGDLRASASAATIIPIAPGSEQTQSLDSLRFSWHAVTGASTYRLVVTDSAGAPALSMTTTDTAVSPPAPRNMTVGRHFWSVDALRTDGTSISGTPTSFSIRAR